MKYVDANIICRFILDDIKEQAEYAEELIKNKEAFVLPEVFAEVIYVLTKVYSLKRTDVANYLLSLISFVETTDKQVISKSFEIYRDSNLDFVDCMLASYNLMADKEIATFDKKLLNFIKRNKN